MISQAIIFASSRPEFPGIEGSGLAFLSFWGSLYPKSGIFTFSEWVAQQPRYLDTFVVSVTRRSSVEASGLLLQGIKLGKKTRLVKIGTFALVMVGTTESSKDWFKAEKVDWTVV